ncbi:bifunctional homocysteine S-methyltransferase/methylenetetrahydrofolate reductase [bacterium]|nr:bifunctional homocysteine S-methyltransferase/methylenetetrahydrofolate reductase [bacterium]
MSQSFLDRINNGVLLGDGAMGTQLYERGVYINRNYDGLNLTDDHLVKAVHRSYLDAGAQVIETNTFGSNSFRLAKYGMEDQAYAISKAGAEIARRCADEHSSTLVAGAMGPLGKPIAPMGKISEEAAYKAYSEQVRGLVDGGVDLFILETLLDLHEILIAIRAIRDQSDMPIVAMMTIDTSGLTAYGRTPQQIAAALNNEPVDVIGLNCSTGPQNILEGIKLMSELTDKPLAAFPNAGEPKMTEGRLIYLSTPEYFAEFTKRMISHGVRFVGGCCGTTPKHIRLMSSAIRALQPSGSIVVGSETKKKKSKSVLEQPEVELKPRGDRSPLGKLLDEGKFPVSCELHPPRSPSVGKILRQVRLLQAADVNVVNIPDGPRASARMSPMALAHIIVRETEMDTILHYTCRDRNILGIQSDLLGAQALNLKNILCVTGDPPKLGDYPMATAVFDVDAIGLLRIANQLNHGQDLAGNPIPRETTFFLGAGFNPGAMDPELELDRLDQKIDAGAEYILTQPVFDQEKLVHMLERAGNIKVPIFVGILPLASFRNTEFFHFEVPGMDVPDPIRERMKSASEKSKDHAIAEGIAIAQEALLLTCEHVQGAYIMPSFGKVEMAIETISVLDGRRTLSEIEADLDSEEK